MLQTSNINKEILSQKRIFGNEFPRWGQVKNRQEKAIEMKEDKQMSEWKEKSCRERAKEKGGREGGSMT